MGQDANKNMGGGERQPQQQQNNPSQQMPGQQNQQRDRSGQADEGQRIDTDNDGRTRDPNDTRPTDEGGKLPPVER